MDLMASFSIQGNVEILYELQHYLIYLTAIIIKTLCHYLWTYQDINCWNYC